jgi:hypothetical protein
MDRRRSLLAVSQTGGKIVLTFDGVYPWSTFDYLYNKYYDIGGSALNPNPIDEEIYLEGFYDWQRLNGRATRLYIRNENEVWLYTEESVSAFAAAAVFIYPNNTTYCYVSSRFTD